MTVETRLAAVGIVGVVLVVLGGVLWATVTPAAAQSTVSAPAVELDRYEMLPGEVVRVLVSGFDGSAVTITLCGNAARRGSGDCNMTESMGRALREGGAVSADFPVPVPPTPCPCVIRVSSLDQAQVAVAPITLAGHPVEPVVAGVMEEQPILVSLEVEPVGGGFASGVRASLGGPRLYDVKVVVTNRSAEPQRNLSATGSVGRTGTEELASLELDSPGELQPGQSWEQVVRTRLPALVFGEVVWQATVDSSGPSVTATDTTSRSAALLIAVGLFLVVDLAVIGVRAVLRARRKGQEDRRRDQQTGDGTPPTERVLELVE